MFTGLTPLYRKAQKASILPGPETLPIRSREVPRWDNTFRQETKRFNVKLSLSFFHIRNISSQDIFLRIWIKVYGW